jgi:hypothetical protein
MKFIRFDLFCPKRIEMGETVIDDSSHNSTVGGGTGTHSSAGHESTVFIASFLLLVMITLSMNLAHYLKHKKFSYLGETAIYIIFGMI